MEIVEQQLLLLPLLGLRDDPQVEIHLQRLDLARLPVLPQPPRDVEEDGLKTERERTPVIKIRGQNRMASSWAHGLVQQRLKRRDIG